MHEVLKLSPEEQADVAAELHASLNDDLADDLESVEGAWGRDRAPCLPRSPLVTEPEARQELEEAA